MARLTGFQVLVCAGISFAWILGGCMAQAKTFRLVNDDYLSPWGDTANDKAPGFGVELVRQVFANMGQGVSVEIFPIERAWMMVVRGERDGILAKAPSSEADRICVCPDEPLVYDRWVMFVRTADFGKLRFSSPADLVGHDVAVHVPPSGLSKAVVPTELSKFLNEHHNLVETANSAQSLDMLIGGRVDYAVLNLSYGMNIIARTGLSGKVRPLLSRSVTERGIYVCFTKTRVPASFVEAFSHALRQFKQTQAYKAIYRRYYP